VTATDLITRANRRLRPFGLTLGEVPIWLGGLFISLLWAAPFVWMVSTSLKHSNEVMTLNLEWLPPHPTLENYIRIFGEYPVLRWGINSVVVAVISTALSVFSGAMAGYALARLRFPGRDMLFALFVASLMVPTEVCVVPLLLAMIKIGWANTYQALILPSVGNVFSVYIFRQFFLKFPSDLEDAAKMDGASQMMIFWRIAFSTASFFVKLRSIPTFRASSFSFCSPILPPCCFRAR